MKLIVWLSLPMLVGSRKLASCTTEAECLMFQVSTRAFDIAPVVVGVR